MLPGVTVCCYGRIMKRLLLLTRKLPSLVDLISVMEDGMTKNIGNTLQPLYNTVHYNTVLDITRFKDGSQKCIDYIEK